MAGVKGLVPLLFKGVVFFGTVFLLPAGNDGPGTVLAGVELE